MSLELSYDDEQLALQDSVDGYCRRAGTGPLFTIAEPLPPGFWSGLADLGVLGLGTDIGGGGALEIAAAMEVLGRHGAPGPLVGTFVATLLLGDDAADQIIAGDTLVSVGEAGLFPWATVATNFIEIDGNEAFTVRPAGGIEPVDTTAGEPWGRFDALKIDSLGPARLACARAEVAIASYVVGAARELLRLATEYARDRVQFNKPIATFQAVSHPLANAATRSNASLILARGAAQRLDAGDGDAAAAAATARLSAVASATAMAYQAHQLFGAMGFTLEGPVAHLSHRIRQVGLLPPDQRNSRSLVLEQLTM